MVKVSGKVGIPRFSKNFRLFFPEELARNHGKKVLLRRPQYNYSDHADPNENATIGEAILEFDADELTLKYSGEITDKKYEFLATDESFKVSLGTMGSIPQKRQICHPGGNCYQAPIGLDIKEITFTKNPGIPEVTKTVTENVNNPCVQRCLENKKEMGKDPTDPQNQAICYSECKVDESCKECDKESCTCGTFEFNKFVNENFYIIDTSDKDIDPKKLNMVDTISTNTTDTTTVTTTIPIETPSSTSTPTINVTTPPVNITMPVTENKVPTEAEIQQKISSEVEKRLADFQKDIRENYVPKSSVVNSSEKRWVDESFTRDEAKAIIDKVRKDGYASLTINKEDWYNANRGYERSSVAGGAVTEAVSTSGTVPGITTTREIIILPGGKSFYPLRQYGQFQAVPTGEDKVRFYTLNVPNFGAITESPTTDITAVTHTLTAIDVSCSVRGFRQNIKQAQLEDYPEKFLEAIKTTTRMESIRDEHNLIVDTLASTDNDFGGTSTAPYHIKGDDGTAITTATLEDAAGEFDETGLQKARRFLEQLGYSPAPGNLVAVIAPRAYETLVASSGVTTFVQQGDPSISRLGRLEMYWGIDIVVSNELLVQNNSYRNLVLVKGAAFALASQRDITIELQKIIKGQTIDVVGTHRIGVDELDKNAYVIVSSKQD